MKNFQTEILKQDKKTAARVTKVTTAHGEFITPTFMPVATRAAMNLMNVEALSDAGSQIILGGNTYHMLCAPGLEVIESLGGMHRMMNWSKPMLTDSGGFQVFSLSKNSKICRIDEEGAKFKHPMTGQVLQLNPKTSIEAQRIIGADIIMAFDQCTPDVDDRKLVMSALKRTHRWLAESKEIHAKNPLSAYGYSQAFFGIIQGGIFPDLRAESAEFVVNLDCDGIAIGGETIGFDRDKTTEIINDLRPLLPGNKTRYAMGVGLDPEDLIAAVRCGIDIFDCVGPTRNARHGSLYCGEVRSKDEWFYFHSTEDNGRISIKKQIYRLDESPIMENCDCHTCQNYTRGYLHYLFKASQMLYNELACIHNIRVMHRTCEIMRDHLLK